MCVVVVGKFLRYCNALHSGLYVCMEIFAVRCVAWNAVVGDLCNLPKEHQVKCPKEIIKPMNE